MDFLAGLIIITLFFGGMIATVLLIGAFPEYVIALGLAFGLVYLAVDLAT